MAKVAITGGIACGKSLVARLWCGAGIPVCEADDLARQQLQPGTCVFSRVVKEFGPGILAEDGSIDRRRLGQVVFSQGERRAALNRIVHPPVRDAWRAWAADRQADGEHAVVVIPLLYEVGEGQGWDAVVCVACSPDEQRRRLRGRGLTPGEVDQRLEAQMPLARKTALSDYVIYNSGSLKVLEEQTVRVWRRVLERQTW